jgi:hypothetical protein
MKPLSIAPVAGDGLAKNACCSVFCAIGEHRVDVGERLGLAAQAVDAELIVTAQRQPLFGVGVRRLRGEGKEQRGDGGCHPRRLERGTRHDDSVERWNHPPACHVAVKTTAQPGACRDGASAAQGK